MQVVLAAMPLIDDSDRSWLAFVSASQGFSIFTLFIVAIVLLFLLVVFVALSSRETIFALKDLYRRRRHPQTVAVEAGAVVSSTGGSDQENRAFSANKK